MIITLTNEEHVAARYAIRMALEKATAEGNIGMMATLVQLKRKIRL